MTKEESKAINKKIIYYYRNNFPRKYISEQLNISVNSVESRITRLRKQGLLKRWWEE